MLAQQWDPASGVPPPSLGTPGLSLEDWKPKIVPAETPNKEGGSAPPPPSPEPAPTPSVPPSSASPPPSGPPGPPPPPPPPVPLNYYQPPWDGGGGTATRLPPISLTRPSPLSPTGQFLSCWSSLPLSSLPPGAQFTPPPLPPMPPGATFYGGRVQWPSSPSPPTEGAGPPPAELSGFVGWIPPSNGREVFPYRTTVTDTGSTFLNYVTGGLYSWDNVVRFIDNVVFGDLLGVLGLTTDLNKKLEEQGVSPNAIPFDAAPMFVGESLQYLMGKASTSLRTLAIGSYSPTWWLMGGVGGGGSLGSLQSTASEWRTQEVEDLVQGLEEAGFRVSVQGPEGWTQGQIEAAIEYRTAYSQAMAKGANYQQAAAKGGQVFHSLIGAGEPGERGLDRHYFGYVSEIKTSVGLPSKSYIIKTMKTAEGYEPGTPAVVHIFIMLNGVKYFIQRKY